MTTASDDMTSFELEEGIPDVEDPYPGTHSCQLCPEKFHLHRDRRGEFPPDWYLYVVHDHQEHPPAWRATLFYRPKGARYPAEAKDISQRQAEQRREATQQKRTGTSPDATVTCIECGEPIRLIEVQAAAANDSPYRHGCGTLLVGEA